MSLSGCGSKVALSFVFYLFFFSIVSVFCFVLRVLFNGYCYKSAGQIGLIGLDWLID